MCLTVSIQVSGNPPRQMLVGMDDEGAVPCGGPDKSVMKPIWEGHDILVVIVVVLSFGEDVSDVRLLIGGVFFGQGSDLSVGEALDPLRLLRISVLDGDAEVKGFAHAIELKARWAFSGDASSVSLFAKLQELVGSSLQDVR